MSFRFPWGSQEAAPRNDEVSLDDILPNAAAKTDLVLLVALCTDNMRSGLTAAFEPLESQAETQDANQLLVFDDEDETTKKRADLNYFRQLDLASPEVQGLKRASVTFFNAWRTAVLRRMGESLKVRPDAVKQAKAKHLSNVEAESRAKRDTDFYAWAEGRDDDISTQAGKDIHGFQLDIVPSSLAKYDEKKRALILNSCLFMLLSLESYPAHSRVLILYLCHCLKLPIDVLSSAESTLAITLIKSASSDEMDADQARKERANKDAASKKWKVGLATVGGAVLVGVTGGLAAPLLIGVAGSIMGGIGLGGLASLLGATIANPVTIAALFGTLGGRMSAKAMEEFAKEVQDFKLIHVRKTTPGVVDSNPQSPASPSPAGQKLRVVIGISGWVLHQRDVANPWRVLSGDSLEVFALQYEKDALMNLGTTLDKTLRASAFTLAQAGAMQLALPAIAAAMLPVSLLKSGQFLDNPFSIAMERSDKAGKVLATALIAKAQGERPVTLLAFSMGARVVYSCLRELAVQQAFGLVENVVVVGAPIPSDESVWRRMRSVVAGRFVNVYTTRDLLLGILYRTRNVQLNVAGLQPIEGVAGVENKDVSSFVKGHNQYRLAMGRILKEIDFSDLDPTAIANEEAELEEEDEMEQKVYQKARSEGRLNKEEDEQGRIIMVDATQVDVAHDEDSLGRGRSPSIDSDAKSLDMQRLRLDTNTSAPLFHSRKEDMTPDQTRHEDEDEVRFGSEDDADESDDEPRPMIQLVPEPESEPEPEHR